MSPRRRRPLGPACVFVAALAVVGCTPPPPPERGPGTVARELFEEARDGARDPADLSGLVDREMLERHGPALSVILPELAGWVELSVLGAAELPDGKTVVDLEASYPSGGRSSFAVGVSADGAIVWILAPGAEWPDRSGPPGDGLTFSPPG